MYRSVKLIGGTGLMLSFFLISHVFAQQVQVTEIRGVISDSIAGTPIENAVIQTREGMVSRVLSNAQGEYRFYLINAPDQFTLTVTKEGYQPYERVLKAKNLLEVDVHLKPVGAGEVSIVMTAFKSGRYIKGQVTGMKPGEHTKYKLLVYVLTDKWYIHPYAMNQEGKGYASIKSDGSWSIDTEWRGYQAYKIAFLVVDKDFYSPSVIEISKSDPDQSLLDAIDPHYDTIQNAPEGI